MSFNNVSIISFNLIFLTQVCAIFGSIIKFNEYFTDVGNNISIPCIAKGTLFWVKEECNVTKETRQGANLIIQNVQTDDEGTYVCLKKKSESEDISEYDSTESDDIIESDDRSATEVLTVYLRVRAPPGPVSLISVRLSTVLGVLMWEFPTNHSGGYPIISFTAEYRNYNETHETDWERLDPNNIPANVRYYEVYHLRPNTTYEFRVWANNLLGAGEIASTFATTISQLTDEQIFEIMLRDFKEFDPIVWSYAVSVSLGVLITLSCTVCLMLLRDHCEELEIRKQLEEEEEYETIGLIPNIILNPMCYEPEDPSNPSPPYTRTIIFGEDVLSSSGSDSDKEEPLSFKRKVSLFFTGDTIKRL